MEKRLKIVIAVIVISLTLVAVILVSSINDAARQARQSPTIPPVPHVPPVPIINIQVDSVQEPSTEPPTTNVADTAAQVAHFIVNNHVIPLVFYGSILVGLVVIIVRAYLAQQEADMLAEAAIAEAEPQKTPSTSTKYDKSQVQPEPKKFNKYEIPPEPKIGQQAEPETKVTEGNEVARHLKILSWWLFGAFLFLVGMTAAVYLMWSASEPFTESPLSHLLKFLLTTANSILKVAVVVVSVLLVVSVWLYFVTSWQLLPAGIMVGVAVAVCGIVYLLDKYGFLSERLFPPISDNVEAQDNGAGTGAPQTVEKPVEKATVIPVEAAPVTLPVSQTPVDTALLDKPVETEQTETLKTDAVTEQTETLKTDTETKQNETTAPEAEKTDNVAKDPEIPKDADKH